MLTLFAALGGVLYGIGTAVASVFAFIWLANGAKTWEASLLAFGWPILIPFLYIKHHFEE